MGIIFRRLTLIRASGGNLARMLGLHALYEILMTTESQDLIQSIRRDPVTILGYQDPHRPQGKPPAGLTNTSSSSNLVFPEDFSSRH